MLSRTLFSFIFFLNSIFFCSSINANQYNFSVVPQQSASKTLQIWSPVIDYIVEQTGYHLNLKIYKSIPDFEKALGKGQADLSYMNPYHYTIFHQQHGYQPLVKAKDKRIKGIIVVKKNGPVQQPSQLSGAKLAFPSAGAFGASLLTQAWLKQQGVHFTPVYVRSHDSGYLNVSQGRFPACGGVLRTLNNMQPEVRDQLQILHTTEGYTPHAIAAHPRVPAAVIQAIQISLLNMDQNDTGRGLLQQLKINGWQTALDSDWNDVRALQLNEI